LAFIFERRNCKKMNLKMENSQQNSKENQEYLPSKKRESDLEGTHINISEKSPKRRFMDVLKDNLTCEMYHAFLICLWT
jgi:hypothetical protein